MPFHLQHLQPESVSFNSYEFEFDLHGAYWLSNNIKYIAWKGKHNFRTYINGPVLNRCGGFLQHYREFEACDWDLHLKIQAINLTVKMNNICILKRISFFLKTRTWRQFVPKRYDLFPNACPKWHDPKPVPNRDSFYWFFKFLMDECISLNYDHTWQTAGLVPINSIVYSLTKPNGSST